MLSRGLRRPGSAPSAGETGLTKRATPGKGRSFLKTHIKTHFTSARALGPSQLDVASSVVVRAASPEAKPSSVGPLALEMEKERCRMKMNTRMGSRSLGSTWILLGISGCVMATAFAPGCSDDPGEVTGST